MDGVLEKTLEDLQEITSLAETTAVVLKRVLGTTLPNEEEKHIQVLIAESGPSAFFWRTLLATRVEVFSSNFGTKATGAW